MQNFQIEKGIADIVEEEIKISKQTVSVTQRNSIPDTTQIPIEIPLSFPLFLSVLLSASPTPEASTLWQWRQWQLGGYLREENPLSNQRNHVVQRS